MKYIIASTYAHRTRKYFNGNGNEQWKETKLLTSSQNIPNPLEVGFRSNRKV